ncbi:hypothetical protein BMF94_1552 [Rhodotorula taiwanensis]|uniref:Major facilitator superfamily (MFS) profile domain-containing protein n=1 Tax=Rhodotorula taiwanensis TaxID=741276 RepID=A0A2S5BF53_9BASI|nr:hypothetical protein BMF94_1552 [Rhodotorula taiwanensis]
MSEPVRKDDAAARTAVRVVFVALLVDLLAFTMPLPLFPRIIEGFVAQEAKNSFTSPTLLSRTLDTVRSIRAYLFSFSSLRTVTDSRWDLTLLGGLLASLFSTCQFLISPRLGRLSDKYGRRPVLLATMIGNLLSALLWLFADNFALYAASRVVGGLAEGNVQLSIAIITDVTSPEARARSLALVGAAFSLAFTLGPSLGAFFSQRTFGQGSVIDVPAALVPVLRSETIRLNSYAVPAAITVGLLAFETVYLALRLPETRGWLTGSSGAAAEKVMNGDQTTTSERPRRSVSERRARLRRLERLHLAFLFFFSGAEFTLTFLTHNLFNWSNAQNGRLLGFIGILSALLQGGYVRRKSKNASPAKTGKMALSGIRACLLSLVCLAILPRVSTTGKAAPALLWTAAAGLAFVSATVVNSLNALASLETDEPTRSLSRTDGRDESSDAKIDKGAALGSFRSRGQLGRAVGPLVTTAIYWTVSPSAAYLVCALGTVGVAAAMARTVKEDAVAERKKSE